MEVAVVLVDVAKVDVEDADDLLVAEVEEELDDSEDSSNVFLSFLFLSIILSEFISSKIFPSVKLL